MARRLKSFREPRCFSAVTEHDVSRCGRGSNLSAMLARSGLALSCLKQFGVQTRPFLRSSSSWPSGLRISEDASAASYSAAREARVSTPTLRSTRSDRSRSTTGTHRGSTPRKATHRAQPRPLPASCCRKEGIGTVNPCSSSSTRTTTYSMGRNSPHPPGSRTRERERKMSSAKRTLFRVLPPLPAFDLRTPITDRVSESDSLGKSPNLGEASSVTIRRTTKSGRLP